MIRLHLDMHIHSKYSDGHSSVTDLFKTAKKKRLDGMAITDHNTLEAYYQVVARRPPILMGG